MKGSIELESLVAITVPCNTHSWGHPLPIPRHLLSCKRPSLHFRDPWGHLKKNGVPAESSKKILIGSVAAKGLLSLFTAARFEVGRFLCAGGCCLKILRWGDDFPRWLSIKEVWFQTYECSWYSHWNHQRSSRKHCHKPSQGTYQSCARRGQQEQLVPRRRKGQVPQRWKPSFLEKERQENWLKRQRGHTKKWYLTAFLLLYCERKRPGFPTMVKFRILTGLQRISVDLGHMKLRCPLASCRSVDTEECTLLIFIYSSQGETPWSIVLDDWPHDHQSRPTHVPSHSCRIRDLEDQVICGRSRAGRWEKSVPAATVSSPGPQ